MSIETKCALIIDDSVILTRQLKNILQQLGFTAQECRDHGVVTKKQLAKFNVIFIELLQFEHNGFQLVRNIVTEADCPVILISGSGRVSDKQWAMQAGAAGFIARPVNAKVVAHCLGQVTELVA